MKTDNSLKVSKEKLCKAECAIYLINRSLKYRVQSAWCHDFRELGFQTEDKVLGLLPDYHQTKQDNLVLCINVDKGWSVCVEEGSLLKSSVKRGEVEGSLGLIEGKCSYLPHSPADCD